MASASVEAPRPAPSADLVALAGDAGRSFETVRGAPDTTRQLSSGALETTYRSPLTADSVRQAVVWVLAYPDGTITATYRATVGRDAREVQDAAERRRIAAQNESIAAALADQVEAALPDWQRSPGRTARFTECPEAFGRRATVSSASQGVEVTIESGERPCLPPADQALLAAAHSGDAGAVQAALSAGADADTWGPDGVCALSHAVDGGHLSAAQVLLDAGARPGGPMLPEGYAPAPPIALASTAATVRLLLDAGADANATGTGGLTALHGAAVGGDLERTSLLLVAGADPNRTASLIDGQAPLHLAVLESAEVVRALLGGGARVDIQDALGYTPLNVAAAFREGEGADPIEVGRLLLAAGADPNRASSPTSSYAWTPLMEAARTGHLAFVQLLLGVEGIDLSARSTEGLTALGAARENEHADVATVLEAAGVPE